jgi:hypothetical protein
MSKNMRLKDIHFVTKFLYPNKIELMELEFIVKSVELRKINQSFSEHRNYFIHSLF